MLVWKHRKTVKLYSLINKILNVPRTVAEPLLKERSDIENIQALLSVRKAPIEEKTWDRGASRVDDIKDFITDNSVGRDVYLDIGCGDGKITEAIGTAYKFANVYGTDVAGWFDNKDVILGKINFFLARSNYPISTANLVTCFQVLHHVPDVNATLESIYEAMVPTGLLILREHHCDSEEMRDLIDVEHFLYMALEGGLDQISEYKDHNNYKTSEEWIALATAAGFTHTASTSPIGITQFHYLVFRK